jgi:hypothetical protein
LKALRSLLDLELDKLAFVQRLVAIHLDGGEVNEDVLARLALNKPKPLRSIKPLDHTLFSSQRIYSLNDLPIQALATLAGCRPVPVGSGPEIPSGYKAPSAAGFWHKSLSPVQRLPEPLPETKLDLRPKG